MDSADTQNSNIIEKQPGHAMDILIDRQRAYLSPVLTCSGLSQMGAKGLAWLLKLNRFLCQKLQLKANYSDSY